MEVGIKAEKVEVSTRAGDVDGSGVADEEGGIDTVTKITVEMVVAVGDTDSKVGEEVDETFSKAEDEAENKLSKVDGKVEESVPNEE